MGSTGKTLIGIGIFSFILPLFGYQFIIVDIFGDSWPLASLGLIFLGGFMMTQSSARKNLTMLKPGITKVLLSLLLAELMILLKPGREHWN